MRLLLHMSFCLAFLALAQPAYCDQYCDYGYQLYSQRRFDQAKKYFEQSLKLSPKNDRSHFYRGVCCEYLNNADEAKQEYEFVAANSTDPKLLAAAKSSLDRINKQRQEKEKQDNDNDASAKAKTAGKTGTTASAGAGADKSKTASSKLPGQSGATTGIQSDDHKMEAEIEALQQSRVSKPDPSDVVPDETRVYFSQSGHDDIYIEAKVNGRDLKMILDTGASVTLVGKNQLEELQLKGPSGKPTSYVGGIGGSLVPTWTMPLEIALGNLKKKVNARVADEWNGSPLLGQDFFNNLEYEIDNKGHCLYFRKPKEMSQKDKDNYCVPFRRKGRHLVVTVEVEGGHRTNMIVDTGAEGVAMTMANLKDLNLDVPGDAQRIRSQGVGGTSEGYQFSIENLRLGPIVQRGVTVSVTTSAGGMLGTDQGTYGLLGQGFFGNWRFTVDNANGVLRFFH